MTLTPYDLSEYWAILDELTLLATEDVLTVLRNAKPTSKAEMMQLLQETIPDLVQMYRGAAVDNAMLFYESTQGIARDAAMARSATDVVHEQLGSNLRWAVFSPESNNLEAAIIGIVSRHIIDGSRRYAEWNFEQRGGGWFRAARPGACAFCRMLATRAVTDWGPYTSAEAAVIVGKGKHSHVIDDVRANQYHDHCKCIPVRAEDYKPPEYVHDWTETYYNAVKETGNATDYRTILSYMRQMDGSH